MDEDRARPRKDNAGENLALLRRLADQLLEVRNITLKADSPSLVRRVDALPCDVGTTITKDAILDTGGEVHLERALVREWPRRPR